MDKLFHSNVETCVLGGGILAPYRKKDKTLLLPVKQIIVSAEDLRDLNNLIMEVFISKGEKRLREIKFTVVVPINMQLLLNSAEIMILNLIRHYTTFRQKFISDSFIRINTGLCKRTIKKAKDSLAAMDIIKIGAICQKGTEYKIEYKTLCTIIKELNNEPNMYRRLELVDNFRGKERALYSNLIEEYKDSNFNNRF